MPRQIPTLALGLLLAACAAPERPAPVGYTAHPAYPAFAERLVKQHDLSREWLDALFARAERRQQILDAIARPAEALPWHRYRPIFLTEARIEAGVAFWREHEPIIARAAREYGVDERVIVAILGVETFYGRITGGYRVLDALSTLGFDHPPRSRFFLSELEQYLLLAREEGFDPLEVQGSYAGAMGAGQFIPSSYRHYAVDFDGDGQRNLWNSWPDAIGSVANYFAEHHWRKGGLVMIPVVATDAAAAEAYAPGWHRVAVPELRRRGFVFSAGIAAEAETWLVVLETETGRDYRLGLHNFHVITRYNRSPLYATAVHELAEAIAARRQRGETR